MKYKINIISLVLIVGIVTSSLFNGDFRFDSRGDIPSEEYKIASKDNLKWENFLSSHKSITFKKCFSALFFEGKVELFQSRNCPGIFSGFLFFYPVLTRVYYNNTINAP